MVGMRRDSLEPTPLLASRAHSHHLGHLEAQFLVCCCQHGQGPCGCILQLVIILPAEQYHQLQPVIPIRQEPLLYLWEEGPWLRKNALTCPAWEGKMHLKPHSLAQDLWELSFEQLTPATSPWKSSLISWMKGLQSPPAKRLKKIKDSPDSVLHNLCLHSAIHPGKEADRLLEGRYCLKSCVSLPFGGSLECFSHNRWAFRVCPKMTLHPLKAQGLGRSRGWLGSLLGFKGQLYCLHRAEALQGFKSRRGPSWGPGP